LILPDSGSGALSLSLLLGLSGYADVIAAGKRWLAPGTFGTATSRHVDARAILIVTLSGSVSDC
jgi:hypothetical protein